MSSKYNTPYWFNESTGERKWEQPTEPEQAKAAVEHSTVVPEASKPESRKRLRPEEKLEGAVEVKRSASSAPTQPVQNCPEHLLWKRDYLFNGFSPQQVALLKMDEVSAFSITETRSAETMTEVIRRALRPRTGKDTCILDGMACVGGNTISFATAFTRVLSNELDHSRFGMLCHNAGTVMNRKNVQFFNQSVLDVAFERDDYDVIFLDPEWGGPDYKDRKNLLLPISGESMEEFCLQVLLRMPRVSLVALKLPLNYDNAFIEEFAKRNSLTYAFYTEGMKKMSLTLLTRINKRF